MSEEERQAAAVPPRQPAGGAAEWSAAEIRRVGYQVVDLIAHHLTSMPARPVFQPYPRDRAESLVAEPLPAAGTPADAILARFAAEIEPYPFGNGHPRYYGWVNSPPEVMGIFGEALAAAMNPSCAGGNHAAVYVERQVVEWFKNLLGLPAAAMGLLVSGGSLAALTALAVARHARCGFAVRQEGLRQAPARLVVYRGAEAHACHQKAVELLGIGSANLRAVPHDAARRLRPTALDAAIREDRAAGHLPLAVVASAGTVNTGAIDPLDEIADVCARHGVWLHVDGAYGAPAILARDYAGPLAALARADSIALDPHKWLYVPVEAGLVLVRDGAAMRAAFSLVPPYLQTDGTLEGVGGPPWLAEYGLQQTRGFRALKVWMALLHRGRDGYRAAIEHDIALARHLAATLAAAPDFEVYAPQSLSIVCFRHRGHGTGGGGEHDPAALDALNQRILSRIQLGGGAFLTSTVLDGRFWLRACIVNPRAARADLDATIELVRQAAAAEAAGPDIPTAG